MYKEVIIIIKIGIVKRSYWGGRQRIGEVGRCKEDVEKM